MPHLSSVLTTFDRTPRFLFEVRAAAVGDFPEADLDKLRPRSSKLIVGICLAPLFGLFVEVILAAIGRQALWKLLTDHGVQEAGTWDGAVGAAAFVLILIVSGINTFRGDWTMYAGAAITAPLVALGLRDSILHAILGAAALALCTICAVRAHKARSVRYCRLSPIFTSRRRVDGTITDISYDSDPHEVNNAVTPTLTIAAGGLLFTATYETSSTNRPAIGHPVAVWLCDQDPDIQVVCIDQAARRLGPFLRDSSGNLLNSSGAS